MNNPETTLVTIGQRALYRCGEMRFPVTIKDTRRVFGRVDVLIFPVDGSGEQWVQSQTIQLIE